MIVDAATNSLTTDVLKLDGDRTWHLTLQVSFANKTIEVALHQAGVATTSAAQLSAASEDGNRSAARSKTGIETEASPVRTGSYAGV